jgi:hypothetical protein
VLLVVWPTSIFGLYERQIAAKAQVYKPLSLGTKRQQAKGKGPRFLSIIYE